MLLIVGNSHYTIPQVVGCSCHLGYPTVADPKVKWFWTSYGGVPAFYWVAVKELGFSYNGVCIHIYIYGIIGNIGFRVIIMGMYIYIYVDSK